MVLGRKTNLFLEKKLVLDRKTNFFLGKTKKNKNKYVGGNMARLQKDCFFGFP